MEEDEDVLNDIEVVYLDDEDVDEDVEEVTDLANVTFTKHQRSVFVGRLNEEGTLAVTGGEDDVAFVWSTGTGEVVLECTGHKDSVTEAGFSFDSRYAATGDMGGLIQVWDLEMLKLTWCYEGEDIEWMLWHKSANVLISGGKPGDIYMWQIPAANCKVIPSIGYSSTCGLLLPDGKHLVSSYGNGQLRLWDLKTTNLIWQASDGDESIISVIDVSDGQLVHTAPNSSLFKTVDGKLVCKLATLESTNIECSAFNAEHSYVATGSLEGKVTIWDVNKNVIRNQMQLTEAVTTLKWGIGLRLYVACVDACIYIFDGRQGNLISSLTGHTDPILDMCISANGGKVLSTSDDTTAKIFNLL